MLKLIFKSNNNNNKFITMSHTCRICGDILGFLSCSCAKTRNVKVMAIRIGSTLIESFSSYGGGIYEKVKKGCKFHYFELTMSGSFKGDWNILTESEYDGHRPKKSRRYPL